MSFMYQRRYTGLIHSVIFDWAGTLTDFGCMAPIRALTDLFRDEGLDLSGAEARLPMGMSKREHIRQLLELPRIRRQWQQKHASPVDAATLDRLFAAYQPLQARAISDCAELIPGARETLRYLREREIRMGTNTGYSRDLLRVLLEATHHEQLPFDSLVCASDVPVGRPHPAMTWRNMIELGTPCAAACVKVDDTVPGIEEGLNAGIWTVAVAVSGNETGMPLDLWEALASDQQQARREQATRRLQQAGAHYVIDSVADLPPVLHAIERRLSQGERP
ncbi:MAG: phosphonoacetaldehyde hydrolase [Gammaproteobacteria bacterium]|nr:phosphonoacetaldehyde hydrolase [Gammaproteobacteria bacterium]